MTTCWTAMAEILLDPDAGRVHAEMLAQQPLPRRTHLAPDHTAVDRLQVLRLHARGMPPKEIAAQADLALGTVNEIVNQFQKATP